MVYGLDNKFMVYNEMNCYSCGDCIFKVGVDGLYIIELSFDEKVNVNNLNFLLILNKDSYIILRMYGLSKVM